MKEFVEATEPTVVYEGNQACISWDTEERKMNKQIDVHYHVSWKAVGNGEVKLEYCLSPEMMACTLTKPIGPQKFRTVKDLTPIMVSFNVTM